MTAPQSSNPVADKRTVAEILAAGPGTENTWLVKKLIRDGDQVILAGAPKTGKSFFAMQLALAVAEGQDHQGRPFFLKPEFEIADRVTEGQFIPSPRKVLFFSFEMGAGVIHSRLTPILKKRSGDSAERLKGLTDLVFTFSLENRTTLALTSARSTLADTARGIIEEERPALIIWDTLVQLHEEEENDNRAMAAVLGELRDLCKIPIDDQNRDGPKKQIAHVIIHHKRKESANNPGYGGESIRGAGAILGAADLILTLQRPNRDHVSKVEVVARHLRKPEDFYVKPISQGEEDPMIFEVADAPRRRDSVDDPAYEEFRAAIVDLLSKRPDQDAAVEAKELRQLLPAKFAKQSIYKFIKAAETIEANGWHWVADTDSATTLSKKRWEKKAAP